MSAQLALALAPSEETQEQAVLRIFAMHDRVTASRPEGGLTPFEVRRYLISEGKRWPVTSVRRAMTCLTSRGDLLKLDELVDEQYGKRNHVWRRRRKVRVQG